VEESSVTYNIEDTGTYVTVGFMPLNFNRMFDQLEKLQDILPRPIRAQAGGLKNHPFFLRCEAVFSTCSAEEANEHFRGARLIVTHCGVGSMKNVISAQKRAIFFPRTASFGEHIDDHQIELAHRIDIDNIGAVAWPDASAGNLRDTVEQQLKAGVKPVKLDLEKPQLDAGFAWVFVSSVGGHRTELSSLSSGVDVIDYIVDEDCFETTVGDYRRFPSCGKKIHTFVRVIQAVVTLRGYMTRSERRIAVLTTGAGVGAVFIMASRLLGLKSIAIESLTRIDRPSLWFRIAYNFASEAYCYSWAKWNRSYPNVVTLAANVETEIHCTDEHSR
jgi:UDP-N-acetylglucosamine transferase subunit ALG13